AQTAGAPVHVLANPKIVPGDAIPEGTDLIVAAHTHARVSNEALARARLGGRRDRRAGLVLRREGRVGTRSVGTGARADRPRAPDARRPPRGAARLVALASTG